MKKAAVFFVTAAWLGANAGWVEIARNDEFAIFQDPATDLADGAVVRTLEMRNYIKPRAFFTISIGSELIERQYDCAARKWHRTRVDLFDGPMAQGKPFDWNVTKDAPWTPVAGEALAEEGLKAACLRAAPTQLKDAD